MPRPLAMPALNRMPGPRRDFVQILFTYLRMANRPTLQQIINRIKEMDLPGAPGRETVRRMFQGETVPIRWHTASAVFLALCDLAGINPNNTYEVDAENEPWNTTTSHINRYRFLWNNALDQHRSPASRLPTDPSDPWADVPFPENEPDCLDEEPPW